MPEMKTLNGYEIVDAKAREDIETLKAGGIPEGGGGNVDLTGYATEEYVDNAISNIEHPEPPTCYYYLKLPAKGATVTDEKTIEYLNKCYNGEYPAASIFDGNDGNGDSFTAIAAVYKSDYGPNLRLQTAERWSLNAERSYYTHYTFSVASGVWTYSSVSDYSMYRITPTYVSNAVATKQDTLVSGTNIKTVNGESILGEGNIVISGGGGSADLTNYYTKTEIDNMFNGIATAEGGSY